MLWSINERLAGKPGQDLEPLGTAWVDDLMRCLEREAKVQEEAEEEMRLLTLLENESLRMMSARALRLKRDAEQAKRENAKKA